MEQILLISSILVWIIVVFNLMLTLALIRRVSKIPKEPNRENITTLSIGTQAPDFNAETLDGQAVSLATYTGKAAIFAFVSPSCGPCVDKIPMFKRVEPVAKGKGIELILVCSSGKDDAQILADKYAIKLPILFTPYDDKSFMESFKVPGTPFYCLVDRDGMVQATGLFDNAWEQLVQGWNV